MENNNIETQVEKKIETRVCNCCQQKLPISEFGIYGGKLRRVCNSCLRQKSGASEKFAMFTTRELLDELKTRGWKGQLRCTRIETINI